MTWKPSIIYLIKNIVNGKEYIGSTKNLKTREHRHYYLLKNSKHHNPYLQNAYNKYGGDMFAFEILEYCEPIREILNYRENMNKIFDVLFAVVFALALLAVVGIMHTKGPSTLGNLSMFIYALGMLFFATKEQID